jgi:hypothetical protein
MTAVLGCSAAAAAAAAAAVEFEALVLFISVLLAALMVQVSCCETVTRFQTSDNMIA